MTYLRWIALFWLLAALSSCSRGKGQSYQLEVTPPGAGRPGELVRARVRVRPGRGFKVNLEFPSKLQVQGPEAATPRSLALGAKQATRITEQELLMEPGFSLASAGEHRFTGKINFSVCTEELCEFKELPLQWVAKVGE